MKRNERVAGMGRVRTEKLGRKVRAQDDGALARATDMRPSTSIEGERDGNPADSMAVHFPSPSPGATYFAKLRLFVRSFVSLDPSSARLIFDDLYPKGAAIPAKESLLQSLLPSRRRKGRPTGVIDTR